LFAGAKIKSFFVYYKAFWEKYWKNPLCGFLNKRKGDMNKLFPE